jgi:deazaflavin-dependent oxidoreductase (nitroreductase family)
MAERKSKPFLPPRWFIRGAWAAHRGIYRITGGRKGLGWPTEKTYGTLRLHTIGRKTGEHRVAMLGYFEDGPNLYTLAMNGWGAPEPAWWLNLQARPEATIDLADGAHEVIARQAVGTERDRLWSAMRTRVPDLDGFAERRPKGTAVVVFEPRGDARLSRGSPRPGGSG